MRNLFYNSIQLLKDLLNCLQKLYDAHHFEGNLLESTRGRWCVRYNDGTISMRMYYQNAEDYKEMFGGEVVHLGKPHEIYQSIPRYSLILDEEKKI